MYFLLLDAIGQVSQHVISQLLSHGRTAVALVCICSCLASRPALLLSLTRYSRNQIYTVLFHAAPSLLPSAAIISLNTYHTSESAFKASRITLRPNLIDLRYL